MIEWLRRKALFVREFWRRDQLEARLAEEMEFHVGRLADKNVRQGMPPAEAQRQARIAVGGFEQAREDVREVRGFAVLEDLVRDLRYGGRQLRRSPGFTLVAVLTLALGIGATTAVFSLVRGVLLRPLDYPDAGSIVVLKTRFKNENREIARLTGPDLADLTRQSSSFSSVAPSFGGEIGVQLSGSAEFAGVFFTNAQFFNVFPSRPVAGHVYSAEEEGRTAVVGESFAERQYGAASAALGRSISVEGQSYEIVGVMPAGFQYPRKAEVWLSERFQPERSNRTAYNFPTIARLKPGVTLEQAQSEMETIGARLAADFPEANRNKTFAVRPLQNEMVGAPVRSTLWFLMGAVCLVLLIACANVANLLLARATARQREIAVRAALGAARRRIARQLAAESVLLAFAGGALGLLLACFGTAALLRIAPGNLPRLGEVRVDRLVLVFAAGISLAASLLFGLAPLLNAARVNLTDALKKTSSRSAGAASSRVRPVLVVAEISLAFVLATGAGLLFRTFMALNTVNLGYQAEGILVMEAHAPAHTKDEYVGVPRFFEERVFPELASIPGVKSVGAVMGMPTGRYSSDGSYFIEGRDAKPGEAPHAGFRLASPGYFATIGVPMLRGRDFTAGDGYDAPFVAIISQSLANTSFRGEDPIGKRLRCGLDVPNTWMTIVGIAGDVRQDSPASAPEPQLYMPLRQHPYHANEVQVLLRTTLDPASLTGPARAAVHRIDSRVPLKFTTLRNSVDASVATPRFRAFLLGVFAGLALLLALAGVYGVMAYVTAQRVPEIGVRMALGATPGAVFAGVLRQAALLSCAGFALGIGLAVVSGRFLQSMLFGVQALDAWTYAATLLLMAAVVFVAAALPAWRATRIDPLAVLRSE